MKLTFCLSAAALLSVYGFTSLAVTYGKSDFAGKPRIFADQRINFEHPAFN